MAAISLDALTALMFRTVRQLRDHMRSTHRWDALSFLQLETLRFIQGQSSPTMKDIAAHLCITPPSTTSIIDTLVIDRLIRRRYDVHDRRIVRLTLTSKGNQTLEKWFRERAHTLKVLLSDLSPSQREQFKHILLNIQQSYQHHRLTKSL